jgi:hypothetical protein
VSPRRPTRRSQRTATPASALGKPHHSLTPSGVPTRATHPLTLQQQSPSRR